MFRNCFFLLAAILLASVYVSDAHPVKRQADSPGPSDSGPSDSGSSDSGSSDSGPPPSGSDSSAPPPSSTPPPSDSSSDSGSSNSLTTGGLFPTLARMFEKIPIAGMFIAPIVTPIFNNLGKFLG